MWFKASIVRNAKDTAHTKAERNILEAVKVLLEYVLSLVMVCKVNVNVDLYSASS